MQRTSKWRALNMYGETIYTIPFRQFHDAKNFAKLIAKNHTRFSLIGCHHRPPILNCDMPWEVIYRIRKESPWKGGVA